MKKMLLLFAALAIGATISMVQASPALAGPHHHHYHHTVHHHHRHVVHHHHHR